jgi:Carboxypeptidase regulatory-like domain
LLTGALFLVTTLFAVGTQATSEQAPLTPDTHSLATTAVFLTESGLPVSRTLPLAADEPVPEASAAWIWSPSCAPQRVEARQRRELACSSARQWLNVTVRPPPQWHKGKPQPIVRVIAAPLEAWHEVPEELLPFWPLTTKLELRLPVDGRSRLRLRVVGPGIGSSWRDVGASDRAVQVDAEVAPDVTVAVVGEAGEPAKGAAAAFFAPGPRQDEFRAKTLGSDKGVVRLPAVPGGLRIAARFGADGLLPRRIEETVEYFPPRVPLSAGCPLQGKVTDDGGSPLAGVSLRAEGLLPGSSVSVSAAQTDTKGLYRFSAVPKGTVAVRFEAPGRETRVERYDLAKCRGPWVAPRVALAKSDVLRVHVVDDGGAAIARAHVRASTGTSDETDVLGVATLNGIARSRALNLTIRARGFLPKDASLPPPISGTTELRMERAASVHGVLVDEDGDAVVAGEVVIVAGNATKSVSAGEDGSFESDVSPGIALEVRASSPSTTELKKRLEPLAAGEDRDLGRLVLAHGLEIVGRVVAASTGEPVSGASIWAARGESVAALVHWAQGATAQTNSSADGAFRLAGLPFVPTTVRVEAEGFAPTERHAAPAPDASQVVLGDIVLASGGTIEVHADRTLNGLARADWRGDWLEDHMITASLVEGEAVLDHVPPGENLVSVLADGELACDGSVTVGDGEIAEFDCDDDRLQVDGTVSVAGHRIGPGSLVWFSPPASDSLILNHTTSLGLVQQQIFGAGRPQVTVDVDPGGAFASDQLSGGGWKVLWTPAGGGGTLQRDVTLPRVGPVHLDLDFPGGTIEGVVHDSDGRAVAGARVVDTVTGSTAQSANDGSFRLDGLPPGVAQLRAFADQKSSRLVEVSIGADEGGNQPIDLVLESAGHLRLSVTDGDQPAAGAVVFIDAAGHGMRLMVADSHGQVEVDAQSAPAFRAAAWVAGRWALGPWLAATAATSDDYRLAVGDAGELRVISDSSTGDLEVTGPNGWALTIPLRQMGQSLAVSPGQETFLGGLPPGTYQLTLGATVRSASIEAGGETPTVSFP